MISGIQKRRPAAHELGSEISASQLLEEQIYGTPDAIKSLNAVSGINFNLPSVDIQIQGGTEGEHEFRLDGVPIYNPANMGRLQGAFSPYAINKIEVQKAGFSASKGSQLSGIINIEQDLHAAREHSFLLQADQMNINGRFDHTFGSKDEPSIKIMLASRVNIGPL